MYVLFGVAALGPTRLAFSEYISISAVTAGIGSALTAGHFGKSAPKVTKRALAPPLGTSLTLRCALTQALERGPPRWAILGPARLNRRPAGLPPLQNLRSASVV